MTTVSLGGNPVDVAGTFPQPGPQRLRQTHRCLTSPMSASRPLPASARCSISCSSLDTPTCATSTRKFNAEAGSLQNAVVLVVSADLPFAMSRTCAAERSGERQHPVHLHSPVSPAAMVRDHLARSPA